MQPGLGHLKGFWRRRAAAGRVRGVLGPLGVREPLALITPLRREALVLVLDEGEERDGVVGAEVGRSIDESAEKDVLIFVNPFALALLLPPPPPTPTPCCCC